MKQSNSPTVQQSNSPTVQFFLFYGNPQCFFICFIKIACLALLLTSCSKEIINSTNQSKNSSSLGDQVVNPILNNIIDSLNSHPAIKIKLDELGVLKYQCADVFNPNPQFHWIQIPIFNLDSNKVLYNYEILFKDAKYFTKLRSRSYYQSILNTDSLEYIKLFASIELEKINELQQKCLTNNLLTEARYYTLKVVFNDLSFCDLVCDNGSCTIVNCTGGGGSGGINKQVAQIYKDGNLIWQAQFNNCGPPSPTNPGSPLDPSSNYVKNFINNNNFNGGWNFNGNIIGSGSSGHSGPSNPQTFTIGDFTNFFNTNCNIDLNSAQFGEGDMAEDCFNNSPNPFLCILTKLNEQGIQISENCIKSLIGKKALDNLKCLQLLLKNDPTLLVKCAKDDKKEWPFWKDLALFKPKQEVINSMEERIPEAYIQYIDDATGPLVNFDFFGVQIDELPPGYDQNQLFAEIRQNFPETEILGNGTSCNSELSYFNPIDQSSWNSINPEGTILTFDIPFNNGDVICSNFNNSCCWTFTTIYNNKSSYHHPVSGNRQFGIYDQEEINGNSPFIFYTRGADRVAQLDAKMIDIVFGSLTFSGADNLWTCTMERIKNFIISKGGKCKNKIISKNNRPDWGSVKELLFNKDCSRINDLNCLESKK